METFYFVLFGVGFSYLVISSLLGGLLDIGDINLDSFFPFFKPVIITIFITVFGGTGLILSRNGNVAPIFILPLAGLIGAAVAYAFYRFVLIPLNRAERRSSVLEIQSLVGHSAKVTEKIPQGQYGKITYYVDGNTYSAPAKCDKGGEIQRHTMVEIVYIEKNTYYVRQSE